MAKPKNKILVIDCCYFADADGGRGDCEPCPTCKEISPLIEVCADGCGDYDGEHCECEENAEHEKMHAEMFSLYQGEKTAGIHLTPDEIEDRKLSL